ncbi:toprim domain-containing protein [Paenibacillus motobuensis]|uniref:toprim domain-containing protein n=1 Tax=Paenibacillus motobuensis TaxID=295324 RepID=UPI00363653E7
MLLEEIEHYHWRNPRWHPGKLEASSPFRPGDDRPSFRVITDPDSELFGCWVDRGASDPNRRRGGPVQLLAILRGISESEARQILAEEDGANSGAYITLRLREPTARARPKSLDSTLLDAYAIQDSDYLTSRGISPEVQALFRTGYDPINQAVTIPWVDVTGRLLNVKYRSTRKKRFWYAKNGVPVRDLIYGIDIVYKRRIRKVCLVESEIDALYLWTIGQPAMATGGASFNKKKRDLILRSPVEELILLRDNDSAGRVWRNEVVAAFDGKLRIDLSLVPRGYKDVGEAQLSNIGKTRQIVSPLPILRMAA